MMKKWLPLILAASLLSGILSGCNTDNVINAEKETDTTASISVPKGRYTEADIDLTVMNGGKLQDIIQLEDKSLEAYTLRDGRADSYAYENGEWKEKEKDLLEGIGLSNGYQMIYGEDNNRYAIYADEENYQFHILKMVEGGMPEEIMQPVLSAKDEQGYFPFPDFAAVLANGNVLLSIRDSADMYGPTGELLYSMPQTASGTNWRNSGFLKEDQFLTIGESTFLMYDLTAPNGGTAEEIPYQQPDFDSYGAATSDLEGGIFIANHLGVHHRNQGGDIWETVIDGSLNSLSLPSSAPNKIFIGSNEDFYIWLMADGSSTLKHYTYDSDMPSVPSKSLTVYGLDLSSSDTIRQAASMFQLKHPDVKVELIDGKTAGGSTTVSDTIRALNTELLGGNGADVLILDGLPVDSYIEKGVLENMGGQISGASGDAALMKNVVNSFKNENGEIYQIPARMNLLIAYGDPEAVNSLTSLSAMRAYQSDESNPPLRPKTRFEMVLRQLLYLQYDEIVDSQSGKLIPGKVKELLETVEILGKASEAKAVFEDSEEGGRGYVYNLTKGSEGLIGNDYGYLDSGSCSLALEKINGLYSTMFPLAVAQKYGYQIDGAKNLYMPSDLLGINGKSAKKELAMEFVMFVLGKEVQENDLSDGLPVNFAAWDKWINSGEEKADYSAVMSNTTDDYTLSASWPLSEEIINLFELAQKADRAVLVDTTLLEIIIDETNGFFEGNVSLEQAAQNTENKANLYFSEK